MLKNKKREDGRVQAKIYLGDGKYKYVYADNNRELEKKVTELKIKLGKGIDLTAERDTFGFWKDKWLKFKKSEVSANWYNSLETYSQKLDSLYSFNINKLRPMDLQEALIDLSGEINQSGRSYSQHTIKIVRDIAISVMQLATENRVVEYNCFQTVKMPRTAPPEQRRALTEEEQEWIKETPHRAHRAAMIMMYAGLRRGELIPLQWSDIDFTNKYISISKSVEMLNGEPSVKEGGKTYSANRKVYIPDVLIDFLLNEDRTNFLVCPSDKGKMMTASAWRKLWSSYISVLNFNYGDFSGCIELEGKRPNSRFSPTKIPMVIPPITAHWLRHTFVTMMYFAGVDVLTAKEQAGHANISTTMEIYTHLDKKYKKKSIDKFNDYLNNGCQVGVKEKEKC